MRTILSTLAFLVSAAPAAFAQSELDFGNEPEATGLHSVTIEPLGLTGDSVPAAAIFLGTPTEINFEGCGSVCNYRFQIIDGQFVLVSIEIHDGDANQLELIGTQVESNDREEFFTAVRDELMEQPALMASDSTETPQSFQYRTQISELGQELEATVSALGNANNRAFALQLIIDGYKEDLRVEGVALQEAAFIAMMICNDGIREDDGTWCSGLDDVTEAEAVAYFRSLFVEEQPVANAADNG